MENDKTADGQLLLARRSQRQAVIAMLLKEKRGLKIDRVEKGRCNGRGRKRMNKERQKNKSKGMTEQKDNEGITNHIFCPSGSGNKTNLVRRKNAMQISAQQKNKK